MDEQDELQTDELQMDLFLEEPVVVEGRVVHPISGGAPASIVGLASLVFEGDEAPNTQGDAFVGAVSNTLFKLRGYRLFGLALALLGLCAGPAWATDNVIITDDDNKQLGTKTLDRGTGNGTIHRQEIVICDYTAADCVFVDTDTGLSVSVRDATGTLIGDATNPIRIDPTGETTQPISGLGTDNSTNSTAKVPVLPCVAGASNPTDTDGRQVPCRTDPTTRSIYVISPDNGLSTHYRNMTATTNATSVKSSAGVLYSFTCTNANATEVRYIAFHNTAGTPTAGASLTRKYMIPAAGGVSPNIGSDGIAFSTGIAFTVVELPADTDATAVTAANEVLCNFEYR